MNTPLSKYKIENFDLKPDHAKRPLWITSEGIIFLEAFSPLCKEVTEFLIAIAEPRSRPHHIHEYELTQTSLYAAASVELKNNDIVDILDNFCKNKKVPPQVCETIKHCTESYGKAKLILQNNKYYIEAENYVLKDIEKIDLVSKAIKNVELRAEREKEEKENKAIREKQDFLKLGSNQNWSKIDLENYLKN